MAIGAWLRLSRALASRLGERNIGAFFSAASGVLGSGGVLATEDPRRTTVFALGLALGLASAVLLALRARLAGDSERNMIWSAG